VTYRRCYQEISHVVRGRRRRCVRSDEPGPAAARRRNGATTGRGLRGLRDDQLDLEAPLGLAGGMVVSVRRWTELTSGHVQGHLASIRAAVEARRAAASA
jgi:hypothetical protein